MEEVKLDYNKWFKVKFQLINKATESVFNFTAYIFKWEKYMVAILDNITGTDPNRSIYTLVNDFDDLDNYLLKYFTGYWEEDVEGGKIRKYYLNKELGIIGYHKLINDLVKDYNNNHIEAKVVETKPKTKKTRKRKNKADTAENKVEEK